MTKAEKIKSFVDRMEDEICKKYDIDDYDEFMKALAKELSQRYSELDTHAADIETVRESLNRYASQSYIHNDQLGHAQAGAALAALARLEGK